MESHHIPCEIDFNGKYNLKENFKIYERKNKTKTSIFYKYTQMKQYMKHYLEDMF